MRQSHNPFPGTIVTEETITITESMPPKGKKYCSVCSNYRGKIVNGKVVSLHRFPANERTRKVWLQRCKLSMKTFRYTDNSKLCSEHFEEQCGPTPKHPIPSIFGTKKYNTSRFDENITEQPKSIETPDTLDESNSSSCSEDWQETSYNASESILDTSVTLHDYCATPRILSSIRNQYCQTYPDTVATSVQTEEVKIVKTKDSATQTENPVVTDFGAQVNMPLLTFDDIRGDDQKCSFYTGIPESAVFDALYEEIVQDAEPCTGGNSDKSVGGRPRSLRLIDEFFMVLMRLRLGLLLEDLAFRFCVSTTTCSEIFNKWVDYLEQKLSFLLMWPSRETIDNEMPDVFKEKFPNTRVIIDCTEIKTETPNSLQLKSVMYSDYKSHMTWKALVGISPSGVPTFTSDLWSGSISDKKITEKSGLLDLCQPGDAIMADKGFLISDLTTPIGVHLIIPSFKRKKKQFTKREVQKTKNIANSRIHVEREMERIKNFRILQGIMPITMAPRASSIWKICVYLTALHPPLVPMHRR